MKEKKKEKHLGDDLISSKMSLEMFRLSKKQIQTAKDSMMMRSSDTT